MCTDPTLYVIVAGLCGLLVGSFAALGALWFTTGVQEADISQIHQALGDENRQS